MTKLIACISFISVAVLLFGITACSHASSESSSTSTLPVTSSETMLGVTPVYPQYLEVGFTQQFTATRVTTSGVTDVTTEVDWGSSDPEVATIADGGLATGVGPGTTTITAFLSGITSQEVKLTVTPVLSSIVIISSSLGVGAGMDQKVTATGIYADGSQLDITDQVTWDSSDTKVATVASTGVVTGVGAGKTQISATSNTGKTSEVLAVTVIGLSSITLVPDVPISLITGATRQIIASGSYDDGSTSNVTSNVTWSSSNTSIVKIDSSGIATALAAGMAEIKASLAGKTSGTVTITVSK